MALQRLWAPWRMTYIQGIKTPPEDGCFFCDFLAQRRDRRNLILAREGRVFAILNRFPYNVGHLMVAPVAHKARLSDLTAMEAAGLFRLAARLQEAVDRTLQPQGYNLGINLGRTAGAGVVGHLHLHVVPRWNGDTNFMPVVAGTKVMPMSLAELYGKLGKALRNRKKS